MKLTIMAVLMALAFNAGATNNNPPNECGNHGNNCQPSGGSNTNNNEANGGNGYGGDGGSGTGVGVGIGLGVGLGGSGGEGGQGGAGGSGGNGFGGVGIGAGGAGGEGGSASAGVIGSGNSSNNNKAEGGTGVGYGGDQAQGQQQGQGQQQSNVGVNSQGQSSTNVSGSKSIAQQALENSTRVDASSRNANQSSAAGNTTTTVTNVGGDSTLVERNAPPVFLGNLTATMSCAGGFNAGASDRNGSGAFGFTWISSDCRSVVIGKEFVAIGMPDVACRVFKTTKGYKRAVKADPSLANVDCTVKPAPAAVVVPVAPELAPRIPRG